MDSTEPPFSVAPVPSAPRAVLVVDDDSVIRSLLESLLGLLGTEVLQAEDGAGAHRQARRRPPVDAAVVDVELGDDDGIAVATCLRVDHPGMRVICMSGSVLDEHQRRRLEGIPFLAKDGAFLQNLLAQLAR